jgi:hypothetical protein
MNYLTIVLTLCLTLGSTAALAMHHDKGGHNHSQHQAANHQGHAAMAADGAMLDLGSAAVKGVAALAHLKDVRAAMAKAGQKTTHHFMVMFNDEKSGKSLETGKVAVKITAPDGAVTGPLELVGMQGHFGADLTLAQPGNYRFEVGSRLADGETRQFEFTTTLK